MKKNNIALLLLIVLLAASAGCKKSRPVVVNATLQLVAQNMVALILVVEAPDSSKRLFIVDQVGKIWIVTPDGTTLNTPFIDVSSELLPLVTNYDERGLLGLAFHPDYKTNGKFYLFYTAPPNTGFNSLTRISEFKVSATNNNVADIPSEHVILEVDHPYQNHNGGTIAFGPDGYLYISIGDGGGSDDNGPGHVSDWYTVNGGGNAQSIDSNLLGKVLRIDVNTTPYSIPTDNPFVGTNAKQEIYAYGFRNPYRFSFDMGGTHQLLLGDVGQSLYEEIDLIISGGNYGWNVKEGPDCFDTDSDHVVRPTCPISDPWGHRLMDPAIALMNRSNPAGKGVTTAVIGGYVYRGTALPGLQGAYVFGSLSQDGTANGKIYTGHINNFGVGTYDDISLTGFPNNIGQYVKGMGQDLSGEIYVTTGAKVGLSGTTGKVYKLVASH